MRNVLSFAVLQVTQENSGLRQEIIDLKEQFKRAAVENEVSPPPSM